MANPGRSPLNGNQIETSHGDGDDLYIWIQMESSGPIAAEARVPQKDS